MIKLLGGLHIKDHDVDDVVGHGVHGKVWPVLAVAVREPRRGADDVTGCWRCAAAISLLRKIEY